KEVKSFTVGRDDQRCVDNRGVGPQRVDVVTNGESIATGKGDANLRGTGRPGIIGRVVAGVEVIEFRYDAVDVDATRHLPVANLSSKADAGPRRAKAQLEI